MALTKTATAKKATATKTKSAATKTATKSVAKAAADKGLIINDCDTILSISKEFNKKYPYLGILFYDSDSQADRPFARFGLPSPIGAVMPTGQKRTITVTDNMLVGKLTNEIQVKFGVMAVVFCKHIRFDAFEEVNPLAIIGAVNNRCEKEKHKKLKLNEQKAQWTF